MDLVTDLVAALLTSLHRIIPFPLCKGDWLSTTALAGAVFALVPVLIALIFAIVRKGTGNRYPAPLLTVFGVLGLVGATLLPWLAFRALGQVLGSGRISTGGRSCFVRQQGSYFMGGPNVWHALTSSGNGRAVEVIYVALLVGVPLVGLICIALLARAAFRRGPRWPGRLCLWIPHVLLILATFGLPANVMVSAWLGYVPMLLIGSLLVLLPGAPRWSVIDRIPAPRYELEPEPEPELPGDRLADTPGPLPFMEEDPETIPADGSRFRKIRQLGKGGFGTVWLAKDTNLGRTVAVKFAHAPDAETEERMMREARALAAVRHPNCVKIFDIASEPEGMGLVMEYIAGSSLSDSVRAAGGGLDDIAAARLWATMAGALDDAHQQGVLHRDVKPSNIILDPEGSPHLIDFGIARSAGDSTLTQTGMMMGTPDFLAPETASGEGASPASDAWQLAATVSFALCGQPPRGTRETPMAALMAAARAENPRELPAHSVHAGLLGEVLHSDPGQRPTLASVRSVLIRWLAENGYDEDGPVSTVFTEPVRRTHR
ncbi:serine/threonine-protein kinase [Sciscionella sediminilitoris]|uniref:serine/threonine-protein kinase n=1 Tax=Sciscionella sediminilitoris TaxID=1445613 RepID=UPI000AA5E185|nr:serine/threonine-protein kinase [Sciscionella sp. SE31]